jgi:Spy/CpxP family protein refolding chaperone
MMHHGQGFRDGSREAGHFLWKKLMGLDLNDKQKDALQAIRSRVVKDNIKKRADLELARVELRELLHKDPVKMSAVEASLKKVESVRTDLHLAHIKAREEVKAILTPEQQKKLKEDFKAGFMMHEGRCDGRNASKVALRNDEAQHGPEEE